MEGLGVDGRTLVWEGGGLSIMTEATRIARNIRLDVHKHKPRSLPASPLQCPFKSP